MLSCACVDSVMDGFGSINWWGFSPAIDFWSPTILNDADKTDDASLSGSVHWYIHCTRDGCFS